MPVFGPDPNDPTKRAIIEYDRHWRRDELTPGGQLVSGQDVANLKGYLGLALRDIEALLARPGPGPGTLLDALQLEADDVRRFFVTPTTIAVLRTFIGFYEECVMGFSLPAAAQ